VYYLTRTLERPGCTLGILTGPGLPDIFTLEDPWNDNQRMISRIPAGEYRCVPHGWEAGSGVRFKKAWRLENVPGRSAILIHPGNTAVDTHGCILVGLHVNGTKLENSVLAMNALRKAIGNAPWRLTINDQFFK
jgi:hypothetical protein